VILFKTDPNVLIKSAMASSGWKFKHLPVNPFQ